MCTQRDNLNIPRLMAELDNAASARSVRAAPTTVTDAEHNTCHNRSSSSSSSCSSRKSSGRSRRSRFNDLAQLVAGASCSFEQRRKLSSAPIIADSMALASISSGRYSGTAAATESSDTFSAAPFSATTAAGEGDYDDGLERDCGLFHHLHRPYFTSLGRSPPPPFAPQQQHPFPSSCMPSSGASRCALALAPAPTSGFQPHPMLGRAEAACEGEGEGSEMELEEEERDENAASEHQHQRQHQHLNPPVKKQRNQKQKHQPRKIRKIAAQISRTARKAARCADIDQLIAAGEIPALSTSQPAVAAFLKAVCRRVFPKWVVWGSSGNQRAFMRALDAFVRLGRGETVAVTQLTRGIRLVEVPWLRHASSSDTVANPGRVDIVSYAVPSVVPSSTMSAAAATAPFYSTSTSCASACASASAIQPLPSADAMKGARQGGRERKRKRQCVEEESKESSNASLRAGASKKNKKCGISLATAALKQREQQQVEATTDERHSPQLFTKARKFKLAADSPMEALGTSQLFARFVHWVFADFVVPLLSSCFYVTEGEGQGFQCLYYRKPLWARIVRLGQRQMSDNFVPVSMILRSKDLTALGSGLYFENNTLS